ncbi:MULTISPECIES: molybdenum cofactor guanylyltransferase [Salinibaculum]|uniref:molybdenum cofactor guanylyltransferase n=1 Tax=Salinibaculum TaxID=2732368 RepID=UPI0030D22D76
MSEVPPYPSVQPVVLAGGGSTRFGDGNKALAHVGGQSLIERVLVAAVEVTDTAPIIAVKTDDQREDIERALANRLSVPPVFVRDDPAFNGPLAGVFGACPRVDRQWMLLLGCDMPLLDKEVMAWLIERTETSSANAIIPETSGGIEPLHALYRPAAVASVRDNVGPDDGFHALLDHVSNVEVIPYVESPSALARSARNINTVAELEALRDLLDDASRR